MVEGGGSFIPAGGKVVHGDESTEGHVAECIVAHKDRMVLERILEVGASEHPPPVGIPAGETPRQGPRSTLSHRPPHHLLFRTGEGGALSSSLPWRRPRVQTSFPTPPSSAAHLNHVDQSVVFTIWSEPVAGAWVPQISAAWTPAAAAAE
eukprot:scaffold16690_cov95-Isochrysis_galbana.AAC.3